MSGDVFVKTFFKVRGAAFAAVQVKDSLIIVAHVNDHKCHQGHDQAGRF